MENSKEMKSDQLKIIKLTTYGLAVVAMFILLFWVTGSVESLEDIKTFKPAVALVIMAPVILCVLYVSKLKVNPEKK